MIEFRRDISDVEEMILQHTMDDVAFELGMFINGLIESNRKIILADKSLGVVVNSKVVNRMDEDIAIIDALSKKEYRNKKQQNQQIYDPSISKISEDVSKVE